MKNILTLPLLVIMLMPLQAQTEKRLALLIGNNNYTNISKLHSPHYDVDDMATLLRSAGFEVITPAKDATKKMVKAKVNEFTEKLRNYDVGMFYYSGHGVEVEGINYLVPVDISPISGATTKADIEDECVPTQYILDKMSQSGATNKSFIMLLDACRNSPFKGLKSLHKDIGDPDTWAQPRTVPSGSIVCYAASGGQTASDGSNRNSPYTACFLKHARIGGLPIETIMKRVRIELRNTEAQIPQEVSSLNEEIVFFKGTTSTSPPRSAISDRDADGIPDNQDRCPDAYGTRANGGCPTEASGTDDYDGDGVADSQDPCPTEKGTANGCPDSDGDGVPDKSDKCRSSYGRSEWEGCPDSDGDGLPDHKDNCPREYGTKAYTGCPPPKPTFADYTDNHDGIGMQMVAITGGTFTMGCTAEQGSDCYDDEKPAHQVTLSDYYIGKYEVTQRQWKAVMGSYPTELNNTGCDGCPVERVSWDEVQVFIKKLNEKTGKVYRLPTEAEWEYAARGGQQYKYSGSNSIEEVAWYYNNYTQSQTGSQGPTHPVGQKKANGYGLYDMSGNVYEWCSDYCKYENTKVTTDTYYEGAVNPECKTGSRRVFRGGGWSGNPRDCRVSLRFNSYPDDRGNALGFRLASSVQK